MVSATGILEKMDKKKLLVVLGGMIVILLLGSLAIYAMTGTGVSDEKLEDSGLWVNAPATPGGVKKSDSDVRQIGDSLVPWPDKLSDIEENYIYGTQYNQPDSDADGMEDGWEALYSRPNPITERLTIDPNVADWSENPDGDGFDLNNNGIIDKEETLFNLREYCGGARFNFTTMTFEENEPLFGGLDPKVDWQEIGMRGGFHLYDDPTDNAVGQIDTDLSDYYERYNPYYPEVYKPVTTNPSLWDTDGDGMDDGWEVHYRRVFQTQFFDSTGTIVKEGTIDDLQEAFPTGQKRTLVVSSVISVDWTDTLIDPLNPADADYDMDIRVGITMGDLGKRTEYIFYPDDLTNRQEYEFHTSPLLWDTDGDSHFNAVTREFQLLHDKIEVSVTYSKSAVDWNNDGVLDYRTCPYLSDTDGDGMEDGWELQSGLDPLNSTDRFKDNDNDGLPNYLENAFPNKENLWFRTDPMNPDTDGDLVPDGWEAYNARIISRQPALNTNDDLIDKIPDSLRTVFTITPMVPDAEDDNDGEWNITEGGVEVYIRVPDGMTNLEEFLGTKQYPVSTNPNEPDTDGDGIMDGEELKMGFFGELIGGTYFTDPEFARVYYTNATLADSDNDAGGSLVLGQVGNRSRRLDDWEETRGRTKYILENNGLDDDGDGFIDEEEGEYLFFEPTNATNPDTDLDGWMDVDELFGIDTTILWERSKMGIIKTDPNKRDTDNDQMSDYDELIRIPNFREWITDPNDPDTDNDGMEDGLENLEDFFPLIDWDRRDNYDASIPQDGDYSDTEIGDIYSTKDRTNPTKYDSDGDRLPDGWEYRWGKVVKGDDTKAMILEYDRAHNTNYWNQLQKNGFFWIINPLVSADVFEDPDHDGLNNYQEYENGTNPLKWDTDNDGMPDGWELKDEIRGSPIYNPETKKYTYILNPLDGTDWALDADHDGFTYSIWTPLNPQKSDFELVKYYFPFINLYEYQSGIDANKDGINDITTIPAPRVPEFGVMGGYDSDSDGMPDGWEVWVTDFISNLSDISQYEDADGLPRGWEELYNGSMWERPECYIYEDIGNNTWDPWKNSDGMKSLGRLVFSPAGFKDNADYYKGRLYADRKDTNLNGLTDDAEDYDSDGSNNNNLVEYRYHTDPTDRDSYPGAAGGKIPAPKQGPGRSAFIDEPVEEIEPMLITVPMDTPEIMVEIETVKEVLARVGMVLSCEPRVAIVNIENRV